MIESYIWYLIRWQLSTPILAVVMSRMCKTETNWRAAAVANLVGGLIFFWIDLLIFRGVK